MSAPVPKPGDVIRVTRGREPYLDALHVTHVQPVEPHAGWLDIAGWVERDTGVFGMFREPRQIYARPVAAGVVAMVPRERLHHLPERNWPMIEELLDAFAADLKAAGCPGR